MLFSIRTSVARQAVIERATRGGTSQHHDDDIHIMSECPSLWHKKWTCNQAEWMDDDTFHYNFDHKTLHFQLIIIMIMTRIVRMMMINWKDSEPSRAFVLLKCCQCIAMFLKNSLLLQGKAAIPSGGRREKNDWLRATLEGGRHDDDHQMIRWWWFDDDD